MARNQQKISDRTLLLLTILFTISGVVFIADASAPTALQNFSDKFYFAKQQALWGVVGLLALIVTSKINLKFVERFSSFIFWSNVLLMVLVLVPQFGLKTLGARRWFSLFGVSIQPAELMKLSLTLYFAKLSANKKSIYAFLVPLALVVGLIMLQPDLGTAVILCVIALSQMFISGFSVISFFVVGLLGMVSGMVLILSSEYRRDRLITFLNLTHDPQDRSYHIRQVLLALGSGGIFGVGLGQSRQKYLFLPEAATDSIFAVIAEETGFVGGLILIVFFIIFIFRCLRLASVTTDRFLHILVVGITAWIGGQAVLNMASMVSLVPLTGIPLPFLSYGGSSLLSILAAVGILLNISKHYGKS